MLDPSLAELIHRLESLVDRAKTSRFDKESKVDWMMGELEVSIEHYHQSVERTHHIRQLIEAQKKEQP